jgi:hypothetical protein
VAWNAAWKNLSRPVMTSNFGKYRYRFDAATIRIIETVAREPMLRLGYSCETQANWSRSRAFQVYDLVAARLNKARL